MKNKKRVLFFGPIGNYGGREVEVNIIAKSLEEHYDLSLLCTHDMSQNSFAIRNTSKVSWFIINKEIYEKNLLLRLLAKISKFYNKGKEQSYNYVQNTFNKRIFNLDILIASVIESHIRNADAVLACVQPTSNYLDKAITICNRLKKPIIVRTTGTINIDATDINAIKGASIFLFHSQENANTLLSRLKVTYAIIDQCSLHENSLLKLPINIKKPLTFGYLGRLSAEKGILELLNYFANSEHILYIAGDGPLKSTLKKRIDGLENCSYAGFIESNRICDFLKTIDVLIISSYEESGPLAGIEAMAAGKIIISTRVGAMPERLNATENQFWFSLEDMSTLDNVIEALISSSSENLQLIAIANRENYLTNYSFKQIKEKYIWVVENAITKCA